METLRPESRRREILRDLVSGRVTLTDHGDTGLEKIIGNGIEFDTLHTDTFTIVEGNPLSAEARSDFTIHIGRGEWRVRIETSSAMTADETTFRVTNELNGYEGNAHVFRKTGRLAWRGIWCRFLNGWNGFNEVPQQSLGQGVPATVALRRRQSNCRRNSGRKASFAVL